MALRYRFSWSFTSQIYDSRYAQGSGDTPYRYDVLADQQAHSRSVSAEDDRLLANATETERQDAITTWVEILVQLRRSPVEGDAEVLARADTKRLQVISAAVSRGCAYFGPPNTLYVTPEHVQAVRGGRTNVLAAVLPNRERR
jgi:hypothetical protein